MVDLLKQDACPLIYTLPRLKPYPLRGYRLLGMSWLAHHAYKFWLPQQLCSYFVNERVGDILLVMQLSYSCDFPRLPWSLRGSRCDRLTA